MECYICGTYIEEECGTVYINIYVCPHCTEQRLKYLDLSPAERSIWHGIQALTKAKLSRAGTKKFENATLLEQKMIVSSVLDEDGYPINNFGIS